MSKIISSDAKFAQAAIGRASKGVSASMSNLVSGKKTDANVADFSVGTVLNSKVGVLKTAILNAGQAKSLLETAKGALNAIVDLINQQKNLAVKASDDSLSDNERAFLDQQFQSLATEINRISSNTDFNGKKLLDGSLSGTASLNTSTGLSTETYGLLTANQYSLSGSVADGNLATSTGDYGQTVLQFGVDGTSSTETATVSIVKSGYTTASIAFTADGSNAETTAQNFIAAARASTSDLARKFEFIESGGGTVTIRTREMTDDFDATTFRSTGNENRLNSLTAGGLDATTATGSARSLTAGTGVGGLDGTFQAVEAHNIGETAAVSTIRITNTSNTTSAAASRSLIINDGSANSTVSFTPGGEDSKEVADGLVAAANASTANAFRAYTFSAGDQTVSAAGSQATISLVFGAQNLFNAGDTITFGATTLTAGTDFAQGGSLAASIDSIIGALYGAGAGTDRTAATALAGYDFTRSGTNTLVVTRSITGDHATVGANMTIDADFSAGGDTTQTLKIGSGVAANNPASGTVNGAGTDGTNRVTYTDITVTANELGASTAYDDYTFRLATVGGSAATINTSTSINTAQAFNSAGTGRTDGTNRSVADSKQTFDSNLLGGFEDITANFTKGANGANNTAQFTAIVNGQTYKSQVIQLYGASSDTILANTKITFAKEDGPRVTSTNVLSDNGFILRVGSSDVALSDVSSSANGQDSVNTIADGFKTQLSTTSVNQNRSINLTELDPSSGDHRIATAAGTVLEGLRGFDSIGADQTYFNKGDIQLVSDAYGDTGTQGSVGKFTVDRLTDTITTHIGGVKYTAYLNSATAPSTGGVKAYGYEPDDTTDSPRTNRGSYDATNKVIDLDNGTTGAPTAKFLFYSEDSTDGKVLSIDLGNVKESTQKIDISTTEGETALQNALNSIFGVSANDSLSFQVGVDSTDSIGISIGSAKTADLYLDDSGIAQSLNVKTKEAAQNAGDILTNALRTVISRTADVDAAISSFNSAITNNESSVQNADAARSVLLDTDYSEESTKFAEARTQVDAGMSVLAINNSRIANLLQLIHQ